jgi:hypothetical protein
VSCIRAIVGAQVNRAQVSHGSHVVEAGHSPDELERAAACIGSRPAVGACAQRVRDSLCGAGKQRRGWQSVEGRGVCEHGAHEHLPGGQDLFKADGLIHVGVMEVHHIIGVVTCAADMTAACTGRGQHTRAA